MWFQKTSSWFHQVWVCEGGMMMMMVSKDLPIFHHGFINVRQLFRFEVQGTLSWRALEAMLATAAQAERNMFSPCPAFLPRNVRQVFSTLYKKMQVVLYKYRIFFCLYLYLCLLVTWGLSHPQRYILSYWSIWSFRFFLSFSMFSALLRELLSRWACTSFTLWGQCSGMVNFDVCSTNLSIILTYLNDSKCILHVKLFCHCIHLELVHAAFAASPHFHL